MPALLLSTRQLPKNASQLQTDPFTFMKCKGLNDERETGKPQKVIRSLITQKCLEP